MMKLEELTRSLPGWKSRTDADKKKVIIGVIPGEGIGPEITAVAVDALRTACKVHEVPLDIRFGGKVGRQALAETGRTLTPEVSEFCATTFSDGGAVLCGPGGGRFVYDLRAAFDLFCKITPVKPLAAIWKEGVLKPEACEGTDFLVVREIASGMYHGKWFEVGAGEARASGDLEPERKAVHIKSYTRSEVDRVLRIACHLAASRRKKLSMILKPGGLPSISRLWEDTLRDVKNDLPIEIETEVLEIDYAGFRLIRHPLEFDVIVASNMFGDIISDLGGILLGARGLCFSGSFGSLGKSVYNTGHGAAYDIAGHNVANPLAHLCCLTMALRVTYGRTDLADLIDNAISETLADGYRTKDIAVSPASITLGTREMGEQIVKRIEKSGRAMSYTYNHPKADRTVDAVVLNRSRRGA
jgi:3-isopropylmalate dehydrogenase